MMFERFTAAARSSVVAAQQYAREFQHHEIAAGHLLLGVAADADGVAAQVLHQLGVSLEALSASVRADVAPDADALQTLGIDLAEVRRRAEASFGPGALDRPRRQRRGLFGHRTAGGSGHLPFDAEAKAVLEGSLREAVARRDGFIAGEHLFLALLASRPGTTMTLLRRLGVIEDVATIRAQVERALGHAA